MTDHKPERTKITPPEVARLWGIRPSKVLAWIRSGELRAIDASERPGVGRPRYRIDLADLADFERRRAVRKPEPPQRRRPPPSNVTRYV